MVSDKWKFKEVIKNKPKLPGSGSSSFSFNLGKAGFKASGNFKNILYNSKTAFFRRYGLVELSSVKTSFARSWLISVVTKQAKPLIAQPASYML